MINIDEIKKGNLILVNGSWFAVTEVHFSPVEDVIWATDDSGEEFDFCPSDIEQVK